MELRDKDGAPEVPLCAWIQTFLPINPGALGTEYYGIRITASGERF